MEVATYSEPHVWDKSNSKTVVQNSSYRLKKIPQHIPEPPRNNILTVPTNISVVSNYTTRIKRNFYQEKKPNIRRGKLFDRSIPRDNTVYKPQLYIVLPTYNGYPLIKRCIQSIYDQTYTNWKLIIVNDGSTDKELVSYLDEIRDKKIKVIHLARNIKLPHALNVGIKECKGKYWSWMSDDNEFLPNCFHVMINKIKEGYRFVYSDYIVVNELTKKQSGYCKLKEYTYKDIIPNWKGMPCYVWTKDAIDEIGWFDVGLYGVEDYDYVLRTFIHLHGLIGYVDKYLFKYYVRDDTITTRLSDKIPKMSRELIDKYSGAEIYHRILRCISDGGIICMSSFLLPYISGYNHIYVKDIGDDEEHDEYVDIVDFTEFVSIFNIPKNKMTIIYDNDISYLKLCPKLAIYYDNENDDVPPNTNIVLSENPDAQYSVPSFYISSHTAKAILSSVISNPQFVSSKKILRVGIINKTDLVQRACSQFAHCQFTYDINNTVDLIFSGTADIDDYTHPMYIIMEENISITGNNIMYIGSDIERLKRTVIKNHIRIMHFGSYWQRDNDIVKLMIDDLKKVCDVREIDVNIYRQYGKNAWFLNVTPEPIAFPRKYIRYLKDSMVKRDILSYKPHYIITNSGGITFTDTMFKYLDKHNIITLGISLSDPDVYPYNGQIYAGKYDYFFTNSVLSLKTQYANANINIIPFGCSTSLHKPMHIAKTHDVVIVAGGRPDRIPVVEALKKHFKVGVYGGSWPRRYRAYRVNGEEHAKALNRGHVYISFGPTMAGYINVKVGLFEAAACKLVLCTNRTEEVKKYFEEDTEILLFDDIPELVLKIKKTLRDKTYMSSLKQASYQRFLKDHTWEKRWLNLLRKRI